MSSPGLGRPLKHAGDFRRFLGEQVEVTLKVPFKGRKRFRGELMSAEGGWRIALADTASVAAAKKHAASRSAQARAAAKRTTSEVAEAAPAAAETSSEKVLDFTLDEVREARLVPVINFKGRPFASAGSGPANFTSVTVAAFSLSSAGASALPPISSRIARASAIGTGAVKRT